MIAFPRFCEAQGKCKQEAGLELGLAIGQNWERKSAGHDDLPFLQKERRRYFLSLDFRLENGVDLKILISASHCKLYIGMHKNGFPPRTNLITFFQVQTVRG